MRHGRALKSALCWRLAAMLAAMRWPAARAMPPVRDAVDRAATTDRASERRAARDRDQPQFRSADPVRRRRRGCDASARRIERGRRRSRRRRPAGDGRRPSPSTASRAGPSGSTCRAGSTLFAGRRPDRRSTRSTATCRRIPQLDAAGNLTFRFGGRLRVSGDADGDYRGDLPITVEYHEFDAAACPIRSKA